MASVKIISEPADEDRPRKIRIISEPMEASPGEPQVPGGGVATPGAARRTSGITSNYKAMVDQAVRDAVEGGRRVVAPGASLWERTKGAGQAAMGALSYAASPVDALARTVVGDPAAAVAQGAGASPQTQEIIRDATTLAGGIAGGAAAPKLVKAAPGMAREGIEMVNKAAPAVGKTARGVIDTVQDVITQRVAQAVRRKEARLADKAPSMEKLNQLKSSAYTEAYTKGGVMSPDDFARFVDEDVKAIGEANRLKFKETLTPQAKAIKDNLESYRGQPLRLEDLDDIMRENRDFVAKAASEAATSNVKEDLRAAQIMSKSIRDFVYRWEPPGGGKDAIETFKQAKELARRTIKMRAVEEIIEVAKRLNDPAEIQRAFRGIAKDKLEYGNFSKAEQKLINELAQDTALERASDLIPLVGKGTRINTTVRGVNAGGRLKKAEELMDLIARGEAEQAKRAVPEGPGFSDRIKDVFSRESGPLPKRPDYLSRAKDRR